MFAGLILTSLSTLTMRAALFQRKARSGWLEELDGIREDALVTPDGAVDAVVDAGDIWTDLRDGGEYADPHEIGSLYATDETPDLPAPRARAPKQAKPRGRRRDAEPMLAPAPPAAVLDAPLPPPPVAPAAAAAAPAELLPPPAAPAAAAPAPTADVAEAVEAVEPELPVGTDVIGPPDAEPMWVQPAPHPIRPSEMWHPADLAPPSLGDEVPPTPVEERYSSSELVAEAPAADEPFAGHPTPVAYLEHDDPTYAVEPEAPTYAYEPEVAIDHVRASELESELAAAAQLTVLDDASLLPIETPSEGGLVPGPVGRRVRRDRPALPQDHPVPAEVADEAPAAVLPEIARDRGDVSPIPEAPLPPAALPTRAPEPAAEAPLSSVAEVQDPVAAEPIEEAPIEAPPAEPAVPAEPVALTVGADGMLDVPGTIVRLGGAPSVSAQLAPEGAHLVLASGWAWVSPGDGAPLAVHIELPTALATVTPGSTVLSVVEDGDATFLFVADGTVEVRRPDGIATLTRGSIAMLDPSGAAQVDHATDEELAADPVVAQNLALDAEL